MRSPFTPFHRNLPAAIVIVSWSLIAAAPLLAEPPQPDSRLHQTYKACGKKWAKKASKLSAEQQAWMLQRHHELLEVKINGAKVMTLELLSGPSFRDCDLQATWDRRETLIRVSYFFADGSSKTTLANFTNDFVFFNQSPTIYSRFGRALLKGVTVDGDDASRWLPLEPLADLYAAASRPMPDATGVLAANR